MEYGAANGTGVAFARWPVRITFRGEQFSGEGCPDASISIEIEAFVCAG
jgi:hypothetical protein